MEPLALMVLMVKPDLMESQERLELKVLKEKLEHQVLLETKDLLD